MGLRKRSRWQPWCLASGKEVMPKQKEKTVSFGFREVPEAEKADDVKKVFDSVAKKYDLMNDLLSFGLHRWWKSVAVREAGLSAGDKVLDIASGTCDLAIAFAGKVGKQGEVWASDINRTMLLEGVKRIKRESSAIRVVQCDCETLPFADNRFDVAMVSFGLRNMTHKDKALSEMLRVVKPGGKSLVLEFSHCLPLMRPFYDLYSFHVMPRLGALVAGDASSYRYLAESIRRHPNQETLATMMRQVGFAEVTWKNLTGGICALHIGVKA